jgi:acyl transferase domain-containing protein
VEVSLNSLGTQAGDFCEVTTLQAILGQGSGRQHPLFLSSIKGNIGHSEAASGSVGLAKLLLMMQKKQITPQASFRHLNPRLSSIADHNIVIPTQLLDWVSPHESPRRAVLNNFGAAGSNAALVVEEYRNPFVVASTPPRSSHILNISAKSLVALQELRSRYLNLLRDGFRGASGSITDLCYSANARRQHHNEFRISVTGVSVGDLADQLAKASITKRLTKKVETLNVFVFSGQANLYRGMGAELLITAPVFRKAVHQCNAILCKHGFGEVDYFIANDGSVKTCDEEVTSQCACFIVQYALAKLWQSWGIEPHVVVGHRLVNPSTLRGYD